MKIFAEGARASEMPIPLPSSSIVNDDPTMINLPRNRKPRAARFRQLRYGSVTGYAPIHVDANDPHTVECAFKKRLMRDVPVGD